MSNALLYFWNKITGEHFFVSSTSNNPFFIETEYMTKIQTSINESNPVVFPAFWYTWKCPFIFYSDNIEDNEEYMYFQNILPHKNNK